MLRKNMGKNTRKTARVGQSNESVTARKPAKRPVFRAELDSSQYLEQHEIQRLFAVIKSKRDRAIFRVTYHRGLRAHEVGILELSDFRDRDGVLFVRRGKGSVSREHRLVDEELRAVRAWVKYRGSQPGPLFPSRQGTGGIGRKQLDRLMKKYCQLAGIRREKAHMHALKHSCGTHLAERDASQDEIQDWLGHREASSTAIYMHFSPRRRRASWERNRDWR